VRQNFITPVPFLLISRWLYNQPFSDYSCLNPALSTIWRKPCLDQQCPRSPTRWRLTSMNFSAWLQLRAKSSNRQSFFVFDTKSTWSAHADALSEATNYPKEAFLPNPHQRFTTGYCSWLLCEYAVQNMPEMEEEILAPCRPGRARILCFFGDLDEEAVTAGDILMEHSRLS